MEENIVFKNFAFLLQTNTIALSSYVFILILKSDSYIYSACLPIIAELVLVE